MNTISVPLLKQGQPLETTGAGGRRWPLPARIAALVFAIAYFALLVTHIDACAGGSDSSGYMNHSRILGTGRVHVEPRSIPGVRPPTDYFYCPLGLKPEPGGTLVPTYPVGIPLLILAARPFAGWHAAFDWVIALHAIAGLVLLYALARSLGLSRVLSACGTLILVLSPLYLIYALQGMSDLPALVWCCAALLAAWRARGRPGWAAATGALYAGAVLIRPSNLLFVLPILVSWWPSPGEGFGVRAALRTTGCFLLGGLPGAIFCCLYSHAAYGSWFTTGYGDAGSLFENDVVRLTLAHYVHWLPILFTPVVWAWLALPWLAFRSRVAAVLLVWGAAYLIFYALYFHTHESWWYLRFVLPAAPALVFGALWALQSAAGRLLVRPAARAILAVLLLAGLAEEYHWARKLDVWQVGRGEATYPEAMAWIRANLPPNALLAVMQTSGAAFYYTDLPFFRWDQVTAKTFPAIEAAAARDDRRLYAALYSFEEAPAFERMPGHWTPVGRIQDVTVWRFDGPASASRT